MQRWLRRIRGAIGTGLTWALAWAVGGILIGVASILLPFLPWDGFFRVFDAPLPALAVPGFVDGAIFSVLLGVAARTRRFEELSLARFTALGALGGLLLSLAPLAIVALGLGSTEGSSIGIWEGIAVLGGPFIALSAVSALGTLLLARRAETGARREMASQLGEGEALGAPTEVRIRTER